MEESVLKLASYDEQVAYIMALQPGERVRETARSAMYGLEGTVYLSEDGDVCVLWDLRPPETGQLGTSVTLGARRIIDLDSR